MHVPLVTRQVPLAARLCDVPVAGMVSIDPELVQFSRFLLDRPQIKDNTVIRSVVQKVRGVVGTAHYGRWMGSCNCCR